MNSVDPAGCVAQALPMQVVKTIASMRRWSAQWQRQRACVGLVPTMGYLHAGHMSLAKEARRLVGRRGKVVVSIYVNPAQFGPGEDFGRYPRDLNRDLKICREVGVDLVFVPQDKEMYPDNRQEHFSTFVEEEMLSRTMEGAARPGHFRGVTTIVCKLFNIVQPEWAVFGAKDYQQAAIVKRMTRDLNFPLRIFVAPICRESDGLAMSSRNRYLTGSLRSQALVLWRSIQRIHALLADAARPIPAARLKKVVRKIVRTEPSARLDYVEFFDPERLEPVGRVAHGTHMALAVFLGKTRLIDNSRL